MPTIDNGTGESPMTMLEMANAILSFRRNKQLLEEETQKKQLVAQKLGMTYPEFEATVTALNFKDLMQRSQAEQSETAALGGPEKRGQLSAQGILSGLLSSQAGAQQAEYRIQALPQEEEAARARVQGSRTLAQALYSEIGGPQAQLAGALGGPNTLLGKLVAGSASPEMRVLQDALNLTPSDLGGMKLPALQTHEERLTSAIRGVLEMQQEKRAAAAFQAAKAPASYKIADYQDKVDETLKNLNELIDLKKTLVGKSFRTASDEQQLTGLDSQIETARSAWQGAKQELSKAKAGVATGQKIESLTTAPPAIPGAMSAIPSSPSAPPAVGGFDTMAMFKAKLQARKNLGALATNDEVSQEALDILMGRKK